MKIDKKIYRNFVEKRCFDAIQHYELLIDENNDPVRDSQMLQEHMNKWDGDEFVEALRLNKTMSALEIGVGTGRIAIKTAPSCNEVVGIDISPKTIERAKENLNVYQNIRLICADFMNYSFNQKFDVVYSSLTFTHIKDKEKAIRKVADLLSDGGRFVLSIDKNQLEYIDMGSRKVKIYPDTPERIMSCIESAGLTLEDRFEKEFAYIFVATKNKKGDENEDNNL